jgi:AraC family transcriptional regulator
MNTPPDLPASVVPLPDRVRLDGFSVAGPSSPFDRVTPSGISRLWSVLKAALPFPGQQPGGAAYGVLWSADREDGSFVYLAGVGVESGAVLPEGFTEKRIPAATYAVFRITLTGAEVPPQVQRAMSTIWGELVPASGLKVGDGPCFERYDGQLALDRPGAVIDFHVPIGPLD